MDLRCHYLCLRLGTTVLYISQSSISTTVYGDSSLCSYAVYNLGCCVQRLCLLRDFCLFVSSNSQKVLLFFFKHLFWIYIYVYIGWRDWALLSKGGGETGSSKMWMLPPFPFLPGPGYKSTGWCHPYLWWVSSHLPFAGLYVNHPETYSELYKSTKLFLLSWHLTINGHTTSGWKQKCPQGLEVFESLFCFSEEAAHHIGKPSGTFQLKRKLRVGGLESQLFAAQHWVTDRKNEANTDCRWCWPKDRFWF